MRVRYEKPPLIEAVCEFRFQPGDPWDWSVPGRVYERIKDRYPRREHYPEPLAPAIEGPSPAGLLPAPLLMRFLSDDRAAMVQVGCDLLAVNCLRPYPGWEVFSQAIFQALDAYTAVARPSGLARIGLRYINRVEVPIAQGATPVELADYLTASPGLPPQWKGMALQSFLQRFEMPVPSARAILTVQSGSVPTGRDDCIAFLVDLDFATDSQGSLPLTAAREWIERAHQEVFGAFRACITPETEALFGRKEDGATTAEG